MYNIYLIYFLLLFPIILITAGETADMLEEDVRLVKELYMLAEKYALKNNVGDYGTISHIVFSGHPVVSNAIRSCSQMYLCLFAIPS